MPVSVIGPHIGILNSPAQLFSLSPYSVRRQNHIRGWVLGWTCKIDCRHFAHRSAHGCDWPWDTLPGVVTCHRIYNNRSRSRGQRSRSQRDVGRPSSFNAFAMHATYSSWFCTGLCTVDAQTVDQKCVSFSSATQKVRGTGTRVALVNYSPGSPYRYTV